jgi:hypothetical protein
VVCAEDVLKLDFRGHVMALIGPLLVYMFIKWYNIV